MSRPKKSPEKKFTPNPSQVLMQRGAVMISNAMQNGGGGRYALIDQIVGEPPHAVVFAATEEHPALLKALLRLVAKQWPERGEKMKAESKKRL